jgi:hypothetical protein
MQISDKIASIIPAKTSLGSLAPSRSRVDALDLAMRTRLNQSFDYIREFVSAHSESDLFGVSNAQARLRAGSVSPWMFCLYSKLVAELSKENWKEVALIVNDLTTAASLPADGGIIAFRDSFISTAWWDHFHVLFDTDRRRRFKPQSPSDNSLSRSKQVLSSALEVMQRALPIWHAELQGLLRLIVLGSVASSKSDTGFAGASTFFLQGATILNADIQNSVITMIDLLVHESSHGLLFGLANEGPLMQNSGSERYTSPLRSDSRPIDGIFHACFVATRVHLAMGQLLESRSLDDADAREASERRQYNGNAARSSLEVLARHASLTAIGEKTLGTLRDYWSNEELS